MRYRRVLSHHPLIESISNNYKHQPGLRLKRYPDEVSFEWREIAIRALISTVAAPQYADDIGRLDCREAVREFYEFRRLALQYAARIAPDTIEKSTTVVDVAFWRVFQQDPYRRIGAHLDALAQLWLDEPTETEKNPALSFGVPLANRSDFLIRHYAVAALLTFDWALLARANCNYDQFATAGIYAAQFARASLDLELRARAAVDPVALKEAIAEHRSKSARDAANLRHRNSEIGKSKMAVLREWHRWKRRREVTYRSAAEFARWAIQEYPCITDIRSVEVWVREWNDGKVPKSD